MLSELVVYKEGSLRDKEKLFHPSSQGEREVSRK
jgi:hypothetical protein